MTPPPVKVEALKHGMKVLQYYKISKEGVQDLKDLNPDIMITCAFGQILSQEILDIPKFGTLNIHASLLPLYRGASPIQHAILNGDKVTGITIMKTSLKVDEGHVLISKSLEILPEETAGELFERLSVLGAECIKLALKLIKDGRAEFTPQDHEKATYTKIFKKEDAVIDWGKDSFEVYNQIRAFNPWPIAYTFYKGEMLKIYSADLGNGIGKKGEIIDNSSSLEIACKTGSIKIKKLQKVGKNVLDVSDFLRGNKLGKGNILG